MQLSKEEALNILYEADVDDYRLHYSGRGMYGESCIGIIGAPGDAARFLIEFIQFTKKDLHTDLPEYFDSMCTDTMAFDQIFYFKGITVEEDDELDGE